MISPKKLEPASADLFEAGVTYDAGFLNPRTADRLFETLLTGLEWQQKSIRMFGKSVPMPRLTCWYGDPGMVYTYSGLTESPIPWTPELIEIRELLRNRLDVAFNSVLANLYRNGADSMGWHSDDERELGVDPVIASVSLGAVRRFEFKHKSVPGLRQKIHLEHGSLLIMQGGTQEFWKHQLPKRAAETGARINLTYRVIKAGK